MKREVFFLCCVLFFTIVGGITSQTVSVFFQSGQYLDESGRLFVPEISGTHVVSYLLGTNNKKRKGHPSQEHDTLSLRWRGNSGMKSCSETF